MQKLYRYDIGSADDKEDMMHKRLFGTNGVRGIVNEDMTAEFALRLGAAIGTFMNGTVVIGADTRTSGDMIRSAVCAGLMSSGCSIIDIGILPTPALQYFVKTHSVAGGVMITASHNPPEFNGIKCVHSDGTEMCRSDEERIEDIFHKGNVRKSKPGKIRKVSGASESYIDDIVSIVDSSSIRKANLKVVLDCANGAAFHTSPLLLSKLGVTAITLNADPNGDFPGHPSEPTEKNLKDLIELTISSKADMGIAHDGDADRTIFISENGVFVDGDKGLAMIARSVMRKNAGKVVTPVSTSSMTEEVVRAEGGEIIYTAVGSPTVARTMMSCGAVFGGEGNGGMIFPELQYCRDGAMTAAKMLECVALYGSLGKQMDELPKYFTCDLKINCPDDKKNVLLSKMSANIECSDKDETDGLKIMFDDGWILLRPSGTEPIFRIYSESRSDATSKERCKEFASAAEDMLRLI